MNIFHKIVFIINPTKITLTLADCSVSYPYGVLEDVLVKVNDLLFPTDFVILYMEEDDETPLLLGRPFLATGRALIDVEMGELMLRFQKEQVVFNIFEAMKHRNENLQCYRVDVLDGLVDETTQEETPSQPLERVMANSIDCSEKDMNEEFDCCVQQLKALKVESVHMKFEVLEAKVVEKPAAPKLKELLSHLKFVFLSEDTTKQAIISSSLYALEEETLMRVLKDNKGALG